MDEADPSPLSGRVQDQPTTAVYPDLRGKSAVVTGAAGGLGACIALRLAAQGTNVVMSDLDQARVQGVADGHRSNLKASGTAVGAIESVALDVADQEQSSQVGDFAADRFGRIDIWVNAAGIFPGTALLDVDATQFRQTFAVNVDGVLFGAQAAARHMTQGGSIINVTSIAALRARPGHAAYCSSKAAVSHLSQVMAIELGPLGIRVNALAPGLIATDMAGRVMSDDVRLGAALKSTPLGRIGSAEEIAAVTLFLASDSARYVTGSTLTVDGGSHLV